MSEIEISKKNQLVSWIVFLPTLIIVLLALVLGMFPVLIITLFDKIRFYTDANPFEPGIWMLPILITSTIIFATTILYRKNKLPEKLTNLFKSIFNFEISQRTALVLVGVLVGGYAIFNAAEIYTAEPWGDFFGVDSFLRNFSFDNMEISFRIIPYVLGYLSMEVFGSYRVITFIASIVCLFLTYLITVQISKKRFAGIVALVIVLQSENFLTYDTTITYPILWMTFYLLSIYFIFKNLPLLAVISFGAAVFSHPLTPGLLPITLLFFVLLDIPKRKKILLLSSYSALIVIALVLFSTQTIPLPIDLTSEDTLSLDISRVFTAFANILAQFRYDGLIVVFLLPLVVGLFLASKKGFSNANAVLVLIGGIILMIAFVPAFTGMGNTPYRILPLVFFFAIGVGVLLSKNIIMEKDLHVDSDIRDSARKSDDDNKKSSDAVKNSKHKSSSLRHAKKETV